MENPDEVPSPRKRDVHDEINELEQQIREMDLPQDTEREINTQLDTIHAQLNSNDPSQVIVEEAK